jgi:hypothetical protein
MEEVYKYRGSVVCVYTCIVKGQWCQACDGVSSAQKKHVIRVDEIPLLLEYQSPRLAPFGGHVL